MEPEVTEDVTPEAGTERQAAPLAAMVNGILAQREEALIKGIERNIAKLAETPDRSISAQLTPDGPVNPERYNDCAVSRNQPTDVLYRTLLRTEPWFKGARDPDQDHWNVEWLKALRDGDLTMQRMARAKSDEAYQRADLLAGELDATTPTALTTGSGAGLLPQSFSNVVEIAKQQSAVIAPLCANFTTNGSTLRVPTLGAVTAVTAAEGSSVAEANPAVASVMLIPHKMGARIILSDELLADAAFNVMQITGTRVGQGIGLLEDTQILTTNGTSPNLTGALVGGAVTETTATELNTVDVAKLFFALGKAYQPNGTWLAGTLLAQLLTQLVDGNGRQMLVSPSASAGPVTDVATPTAIGTIFGRPVYHVPAVAGDLIFGDLRSYAIVRKGGIEAKASTEVGFATDTTQFKFTQRIDGQLIDAVGIKEFQGITGLG